MKKITPHISSILLALAIISVPLFVMFLHNASVSHQLGQAKQEITELRQQLALEQAQHCEQTYTWKAGRDYPATVTSDDVLRSYRVHTPSDYTVDRRYPVIVVFDGLNGTSRRAEAKSGLNEAPALTVYPDALIGTTGATAWQGAPYSPAGINDVQFIGDMLRKLTKEFCIDTDAVYLVGMSNGAGFAHLAACELGDRIAGVAGISGAYYQPCAHMPAQRMLYIHSVDDALVPYAGSLQRKLPSIYAHAHDQSSAAHCRRFIRTGGRDVERLSWSQCKNDQHISLIITHRQPHGWLHVSDAPLTPKGALSHQTTSAVIWDFFTATSQ
ncbi:MAG TPA: alpha/beta hydrolase-fold protein [Candidatus Saccharibacteria bacterium]|nr:alpha/beta hydrolase-fold protein [Candidatus Saccharibacteria bacterium]